MYNAFYVYTNAVCMNENYSYNFIQIKNDCTHCFDCLNDPMFTGFLAEFICRF